VVLSAAAAQAALIEQHLPLVHFVARRFLSAVQRSAVVDYDDLVGYGTEGLLYAAERFDSSRGFQFSTFAGLHIRTTIQDALRGLDPVTRKMRTRGAQIEQTRMTLAQTQGTLPTDTAVAAVLGLNVTQVRRGRQQTAVQSVSLEAATDAVGERGVPGWMASLADADPGVDPARVLDRTATQGLLVQALATLPERERQIILESYAEGSSLRQIAVRLGLSEARVAQLRIRALKRLRIHLTTALDLSANEHLAA
jgi:RNA polymerase sigma factor for flagellar operon FliA